MDDSRLIIHKEVLIFSRLNEKYLIEILNIFKIGASFFKRSAL